MENNDWITEAFKKAQSDAAIIGKYATTIQRFLDEHTPAILDGWAKIVGKDKAALFSVLLSENDELRKLVDSLTGVFTTAGYMLAKAEDMKNET